MSLIATQSNLTHPPIRPTLVSQHALSSEDSLGEMPSESSMQLITKLPQHRYHMRVMQSLPIYADPPQPTPFIQHHSRLLATSTGLDPPNIYMYRIL